MKPEYFPPKEDVILQNEAPTDFYIVVTGAMVTANCLRFCFFFIFGASVDIRTTFEHTP